MHRIPLAEVKEVILSRERGTWAWLKWVLVLFFGLITMAGIVIGLMESPAVKPGIGAATPIAFIVVGLSMLIDRRWRLVLTIRTEKKDWQWRPHVFDKKDEVKALREGFLGACRYVRVPTRRLDLANESEIRAFWRWAKEHIKNRPIDAAALRKRLHKLCDRLDVVITDGDRRGDRELIITANYARDAFPIVDEVVFAAPKIPDLRIRAFLPRRTVGRSYKFDDTEISLDQVFFIPYTDGFTVGVEIRFNTEIVERPQEFAVELCKALLGEYDTIMYVQFLDIGELDEVNEPSYLRHISQLPDYIDEFHCLDA